jgi:hypothetical protein
MIFATLVARAFQNYQGNEFLGDSGERSDRCGQPVLHPVIGFSPYLVGAMPGFIGVVRFQAFPDLLSTHAEPHGPILCPVPLKQGEVWLRMLQPGVSNGVTLLARVR